MDPQNKLLNLCDDAVSTIDLYGIDSLLISGTIRAKRGVSIFRSEVDSVEIADEIKIGVCVGHHGRWGAATLEQLDGGRLEQAIAQAKAAAAFSDPDLDLTLATPENPPCPPLPKGEKEQHSSLLNVRDALTPPLEKGGDLNSLTMPELETMALVMESAAAAHSPLIRNVPETYCGFHRFTRVLVNSTGVRISEPSAFLLASLSVMAAGTDARMVNASENITVRERRQFDPLAFAQDVADEATRRVAPRGVASGTWPVILDPKTAAQLLSTFSAVASGDFLYRKLTRLEGKQGAIIAAPCVSIVDSGARGLVPHRFDGEGTPCQEKSIIDRGRFTTFLHNRYTGRKTGATSTGNADEAMGKMPGVSPANLAWDGDITDAKTLYGAMKRGILIKELHGASASAISGDFSYGALGYWIENGEIAYPVADFTIAGNFFDLLLAIDGVGDDLRYVSPHLFGSCGGRSLFIRGLSVSGT